MPDYTPKTLYLVRHAEPEAAYTRRFLGRMNPDLSPIGVEQAESAARLLAGLKPQRIFSSPLLRAKRTAGIVARACGVPVEENELLLEINFGELEGMTFREASAAYPGFTDSWQALSGDFTFPGGEKFSDFNKRAADMAELARTCGEERVALVAHGGILRGVLCNLLDIRADGPLRFRLAYAAVTTLEIDARGNAVMTGFNAVAAGCR